MGGRLGLFVREWSRITEDSWVLGTITDGYRLEFTETPPLLTPFRTTPVPFDPILASLLREEVRALLAKEAIVPLTGLHPDMVTSMFFLAPKKNGQWRPILNLRPLNIRSGPLQDGATPSSRTYASYTPFTEVCNFRLRRDPVHVSGSSLRAFHRPTSVYQNNSGGGGVSQEMRLSDL